MSNRFVLILAIAALIEYLTGKWAVDGRRSTGSGRTAGSIFRPVRNKWGSPLFASTGSASNGSGTPASPADPSANPVREGLCAPGPALFVAFARHLLEQACTRARPSIWSWTTATPFSSKGFEDVLGVKGATALLRGVAFHYTPDPRGLDMAEIEIGILVASV